MRDSRGAFLIAAKNLPRWMDVHKRPMTSVGGKFLHSIIEEQDNIAKELNSYISDFFLLSYVGREHEIADYLYILPVGSIDTMAVLNLPLSITDNAEEFLKNPTTFALLQEEHLLIHPAAISEDKAIQYTYNGFSYGGTMTKFHVWNVFDEFAMFSSLERFDGETNAELLKRCFLAFQNATNSTESGLKNTIVNTVSNYIPLAADDIIIEKPSEQNLEISDDEYGTIYERLAKFNRDFFRTKQWDMETWEHGFKQLDFIPHIWDEKLDIFQDGVGQNNDLKTGFTDENDTEATNVSVIAYEASQVMIDEYIHKQNIKKEIPLKLSMFKNELKAKEVEYKIMASDAKEIDATKIFIKSQSLAEGESSHYLSDLVVDPGTATVTNRGILDAGAEYALKFLPRDDYSDMIIEHANFIDENGNSKSLLKDTGNFKNVKGVFKNLDVLLHANELKHLKTFKNIENCPKGLKLGSLDTSGSFSVDVSDMGGKLLRISHECQLTDITANKEFFTLNGFEMTQQHSIVANDTGSSSNAVIELDCNAITFELMAAADPAKQGSCTVMVTVDGKIDATNSGLWSYSKKCEMIFDKFSHVKISIQKAGMFPVEIRSIKASRYEIDYRLERGAIIKTPFSMMLPELADEGKNTLYVTMKSYSAYSPVINYIHVGASMRNAKYEIGSIIGTAGSKLDIVSNCKVELYKVSGGNKTLVNGDYITKSMYKNNTNENALMIIDTDGFVSIQNSSKTIFKTTSNGRVVSYISLIPGEEIDSIDITGKTYILHARKSLKELLFPADDRKVYISKGANGFILRNPANNEEEVAVIKRENLDSLSDIFTYEGLPAGAMNGCFTVDTGKNISVKKESFDRAFEHTYVELSDAVEYVAYNKVNMLKSSVSGVALVNTFSPLLDTSKMMYYRIAEINGSDIKGNALFEKTFGGKVVFEPWSLGIKPNGIKVEIDFAFENSDSYGISANQLNEVFVISNNIELNKTYMLDGKPVELARYIIAPPDEMNIVYDFDSCWQEFIAEEDGFNKLFYSNIEAIISITVNGVAISSKDFSLLKEEGILVWNTAQYVGKSIKIAYSYKTPKYLRYKNIESLYEMVGYSTEAYKAISELPIEIKGATDGTVYDLDFPKKPDKIVIKCSNVNFQAIIENGSMLRVKKISADNVATIKTGYYYDDGDEYYLFDHMHSEVIDRMSNVEMHYVKRYGNTLQFIMRSANYLLDTNMQGSREEELCHIDFVDNENTTDGISSMKALTACDAYNGWVDFNMDVSMRQSVNGLGTHFESTSDSGYAIMDITKVVGKETIMTLSATASLKTTVLKEVKAGGDSLRKSIFADPYGVMEDQDGYRSIVFGKDVDLSCRYYLMVTGSGTIDDIVTKAFVDGEKIKYVHTKNLSALGLDITEKAEKEFEHQMLFDVDGNTLSQLEIDNSGKIRTGSNVDWGLTQIYSVKNDMKKCVIKNAALIKDAFYTDDTDGKLVTPIVYLRNQKAMNSVFIKINDIPVGKMKSFNIRVKGAETEDSPFKEIAYEKKTNLLQVFSTKLLPYLQIEVEMPSGRVINNIEIYAKYAETDSALHITPNEYGEIVTKVYDTTYKAAFKPVRIEGQGKNTDKIRLFIRGCKEDSTHEVWTQWYEYQLNSQLEIVNEPHIFEDYHLFQFKIAVNDSDAEISVKSFVFEVV